MQQALGPYLIDQDSTPLIIAEIGTAHNGDTARAYELIDACKESGADFAKFQYIIADEIIHKHTGTVPLPGGETPLYEVFSSLERSVDFYKNLKEYCQKRGIEFLCTPFGQKSAEQLFTLGVSAVKIASPELNHTPLLRTIRSMNLPVIVSTGVSRLADIERAIEVLGKNPVLLHCVTSYPAPEEQYNIKIVSTLSRIFGCITGVSDHTRHPFLIPVLAGAYGGKLIEKHITLDNKGTGLDDPIALTPDEFSVMTSTVRRMHALNKSECIAELEREFGAEKIQGIIGDGVKRTAPSESENYGRTNRSLHAVRSIAEGEVIVEDAVAVLRTEKILRPGLHPDYLPEVIGARAVHSISSGEGIRLTDIIPKETHPD